MNEQAHSSRLVRPARVRQYLKEYAERAGRGPVCRRVGADVYAHLDAVVRKEIRALVNRHPSGFATVKA